MKRTYFIAVQATIVLKPTIYYEVVAENAEQALKQLSKSEAKEVVMTDEQVNRLCRIAANALKCDWNDFEIEYISEGAIMVRLDSDGLNYLVEVSGRISSERD